MLITILATPPHNLERKGVEWDRSLFCDRPLYWQPPPPRSGKGSKCNRSLYCNWSILPPPPPLEKGATGVCNHSLWSIIENWNLPQFSGDLYTGYLLIIIPRFLNNFTNSIMSYFYHFEYFYSKSWKHDKNWKKWGTWTLDGNISSQLL